jgi:predicted RNA-binding Zn ribbon-like protein
MGDVTGDSQRRVQRETRQLRALRFDAGSPALDLVSTLARRGGGRPVERLTGLAELREWLQRVGLPVEPAETNLAFLTRLRRLREALHEVLSALVTGQHPADAALDVVNAQAAAPWPAPRLTWSTTGPRVERPGSDTAEAVLTLLARDGIAHVEDPDRRARLAICAAADCRMLYLDTSGGRRRRWCSMRHCGNRAKAARHRARRQGDTDSTDRQGRAGLA